MNNAAFCFYLFSRQNFLLCPMIGKMNNRCTVCLYCFVMVIMILALYTKGLQKGAPPIRKRQKPWIPNIHKFFDKHQKKVYSPARLWWKWWTRIVSQNIRVHLSFLPCSLCNSHPPRPLNKTRHTQPGHPEKKRKNGKNQDLVWLLIQRKIKHNRVVTNNTECKNEVISLENCF
jgi:hypothetical protein